MLPFQNDPDRPIDELGGEAIIAGMIGTARSVVSFAFDPKKVEAATWRVGGHPAQALGQPAGSS